MDEQQQANGEQGHAGASRWRVNGAPTAAGAPATAGVHNPEQAWSSAGAALEPSAEPLTLLANHGGDARHRQPYTPGLDDDTPAGGVPAMEPPLWREAARHSRGAGSVYSSHYPDYPPAAAPVPEPAAYEPPTVPAEPYAPPAVPPPPPAPPPPVVPPPPSAPPGATAELPTPVISLAPRSAPPVPVESASLPQRVPAEPDVPFRHQPDPDFAIEPARERERWTAPELAWIADQLRRDDVPGERPPETLDVEAVVAAVREVSGVESATVRANPTGIHTLRLDLADDADPGQVSSTVARLLLERMGLSAAPQHVPHARVSEETTAPLAPEETTVPLAPPPAPMPEPVWPAPAEGSWEYEPPQPELDPLADGPLTTPPEERPELVSRPIHSSQPGPRVVIDQVQVSTFGLEAVVEVQLTAGDRSATGEAAGPAVDSYVTRLAAVAAAKAIDELLRGGTLDRAGELGGGPSRCFVEHTGVVSFGNTEVAVAVVLLVCGGWVEKLTGSALVDTDSRQAVVRATLGAVNRRLEALLD